MKMETTIDNKQWRWK